MLSKTFIVLVGMAAASPCRSPELAPSLDPQGAGSGSEPVERETRGENRCLLFGSGAAWIGDADGDGERDLLIPDTDCGLSFVNAAGEAARYRAPLFVVSGKDGALIRVIGNPVEGSGLCGRPVNFGTSDFPARVLVPGWDRDELGKARGRLNLVDPLLGSISDMPAGLPALDWIQGMFWVGEKEKPNLLVRGTTRDGSTTSNRIAVISLDGGPPNQKLKELGEKLDAGRFGKMVEIPDVDEDGERDFAVELKPRREGSRPQGGVLVLSGRTLAEILFIPRVQNRRSFGAGLAVGDFLAERGLELAIGSPYAREEGVRSPYFSNVGEAKIYVHSLSDGRLLKTLKRPAEFPEALADSSYGSALGSIPSQQAGASGPKDWLVIGDDMQDFDGIVWAHDVEHDLVKWRSIHLDNGPGHYGESLAVDLAGGAGEGTTRILVGTAGGALSADHTITVVDGASGRTLFTVLRSRLRAAYRQKP